MINKWLESMLIIHDPNQQSKGKSIEKVKPKEYLVPKAQNPTPKYFFRKNAPLQF